jgi:hypothetical protein
MSSLTDMSCKCLTVYFGLALCNHLQLYSSADWFVVSRRGAGTGMSSDNVSLTAMPGVRRQKGGGGAEITKRDDKGS